VSAEYPQSRFDTNELVHAASLRSMIPRSRRNRNIAAAIIGNTLEWYDILAYAYFVKAIAANFFPAANGASSLLLAYGTFGLSFVARPLGALVIGRIADRRGRRTALVYASVLMFIGTLAIALLPTHNTIGVAAPILLLAARLVQGFSVGGEFGSAAAYLAEQSINRRAFYSSLQFASQGMGMITAALVGLALAAVLSGDELTAWGWRIPFLIGAALGPVAYLIRRNADETEEFLAVDAHGVDSAPAEAGADVRSSRARFVATCALGAGVVLACNVTLYFLVYIPTFAQTALGADPAIAYTSAILSGSTLLFGAPVAGLLADRFGAQRHGIVAALLIIVTTYPLFVAMIAGANVGAILIGQFGLAIVASLYVGALPAILAEMFETRNRSLGVSISYNLAVMTGGGFAQMIFVALISVTGSNASPCYYVIASGAISLGSLLLCRRFAKVDRTRY
jgi:MFS transporter, MHS family, proline/betaine transporter